MRVHMPEIERRRRQLEVIEKKARTAEARKDSTALEALRTTRAATTKRIAELEALEQPDNPRRRRGAED